MVKSKKNHKMPDLVPSSSFIADGGSEVENPPSTTSTPSTPTTPPSTLTKITVRFQFQDPILQSYFFGSVSNNDDGNVGEYFGEDGIDFNHIFFNKDDESSMSQRQQQQQNQRQSFQDLQPDAIDRLRDSFASILFGSASRSYSRSGDTTTSFVNLRRSDVMNLVNDATFYITSSSSASASASAAGSETRKVRRPSHISDFVSKMILQHHQNEAQRQRQKQRQQLELDEQYAKSIQRQIGRIGLRQRSRGCRQNQHQPPPHTPPTLPPHQSRESRGGRHDDHIRIVFTVEIPKSYMSVSLVSRLKREDIGKVKSFSSSPPISSPIPSSIVPVAPGMTHTESRSSSSSHSDFTSDCTSGCASTLSGTTGGTTGGTTTLKLVRTPNGWAISSSDTHDFDEKGKKSLSGVDQGEDELQEERQEQESEHVDFKDFKGVQDDQRHHVTPSVFSSFSNEVRDATPPSFDLPNSLLSFMDQHKQEENMNVDEPNAMIVASEDAAASTSSHHRPNIFVSEQDEKREVHQVKDSNNKTTMATPSASHESITATASITPSPFNFFKSLRDIRFRIPPLPPLNVLEVSSSFMDVDDQIGESITTRPDDKMNDGDDILSPDMETKMEECGSTGKEDLDYDDDMDLLIGPFRSLEPSDSFVRPLVDENIDGALLWLSDDEDCNMSIVDTE